MYSLLPYQVDLQCALMKCVAMVRLVSRASVKKKSSRGVNCPNQINEKLASSVAPFFCQFLLG